MKPKIKIKIISKTRKKRSGTRISGAKKEKRMGKKSQRNGEQPCQERKKRKGKRERENIVGKKEKTKRVKCNLTNK